MSRSTLPAALLEQAAFLVNREPKRPKDASLRRAVSTAYYALFHLLTSEAASALAPNASDTTHYRIQRWFQHQEMLRVCSKFNKPVPDKPLDQVLAAISLDLQALARAFIQLQQQRHEADYDLSASFTRLAAKTNVDRPAKRFAHGRKSGRRKRPISSSFPSSPTNIGN